MIAVPATVAGVDGVKTLAGRHLGHTPYREITQETVDRPAAATGDHQWIHVDPERAKDGPFGGTIAHGYWRAHPVTWQDLAAESAADGRSGGLPSGVS